jgi:hypothetical protein
MSDDPNKAKEVQMNSALVKQKHRMAAGEKVDGQSLPTAPAPAKNQA